MPDPLLDSPRFAPGTTAVRDPPASEPNPIPLTSVHPVSAGPRRAVLALALIAATLAACDPDVARQAPIGEPVGGVPTVPAPPVPAPEGPVVQPVDEPAEPPTTGAFSLRLPDAPIALVEGGASVEIAVAVTRGGTHSAPVTLRAIEDGVTADGLLWTFADERLEGGRERHDGERGAADRAAPEARRDPPAARGRHRRHGRDRRAPSSPSRRRRPIAPTSNLLAGQSNMVGSTLDGARRADPGEADAPDPRIFQLDVTINDLQRFPAPSAYTDVARIAAPDERIVQALDPLHDIRDRGKDTKSGETIGLGLSFAKAALADTSADIVLVPAAWSDTGFCLRATSRFEGATGWNAARPAGTSFAGTLLHDRAIARTNLAIEETGGILRGILWHQGEADSDDITCALAYDENLRDMVASLRTNIDPDARGPLARGPLADIPFVLGTMSKGDDDREDGQLAPGGVFPEPKSIVDGVHRNVASVVPLSAVVNADDLVPSTGFPCGQGFCIHFGAAALRELGVRYHARLSGLFDGP